MTKSFVPDAGENLIGVIRPSLWFLVPRLVVAAALLIFPFVFLFPLLGLGLFGIGLGVLVFVFGLRKLITTRSTWLRGSLIVTDRRVIDVIRLGRRPRILAIAWPDVESVDVVRTLVGRVLGLGRITVHAKKQGVTLVFPAIPRPETVKTFIGEVQLHTGSRK